MLGWQTISLGKAVTFQRGYDLPHYARKTGNVPIVSSAGVTAYHSISMVEPPGVVTGRYGTIGEIFFISEAFWPLNTTLYVRDFHGNDPYFIHYLLQRFDFISFSGKSGVPGVNRNDLHSELISLPIKIEEQRAIATALSDVDALLGALEQLIAKKRDLKQAAMQQLLTGKTRLPGEWIVKPGYKQTEVGTIPEDWECRKLEDYFSFISYGFTNPMPTVTSGIFMITAADINKGRIQFETARKTTETAYHNLLSLKSKPKKNDILLTKDGTLGRLAIVGDEQLCINQSVAVIRPNEKIETIFLKFLLESPNYQKKMIEDAGGSTIKHIYITIVNLMLLGLPSNRKEQRAIATVIASIDSELAVLEQRRDKTRAIKQAMMQELLTGRTRLV